MNTFWDFAVLLGGYCLLQIAWTLAIRTFPEFIGGALLKGIEHRNTVEIERFKDQLGRETQSEIERLRADYATLKSSVDYLSANQGELRSKMIAATERMWKNLQKVKDSFSDAVYLEEALLPKELDVAFVPGRWPNIMDPARKVYADEQNVLNKIMDCTIEGHERLFVGDRLWLIHFVFRALHFRMGLLLHRSFAQSRYNGWRNDEMIRQQLSSVLGEEEIKPFYTMDFPSLPNIIARIEAEFLKEGMRIMSGSKFFADSVTDVQSTLRYLTLDQRSRQT